MKLSIYEISLVIPTFEFKATCSRFFAILKVPGVFDFIKIPWFCSISMLLVFEPFSFIHTSICVYEDTIPIRFTIAPFSLVNIPICMRHSTFTIKNRVLCLSMVWWAIRKFDYSDSFPLFLIFCPLPSVLPEGRWIWNVLILNRLEVIHPY